MEKSNGEVKEELARIHVGNMVIMLDPPYDYEELVYMINFYKKNLKDE